MREGCSESGRPYNEKQINFQKYSHLKSIRYDRRISQWSEIVDDSKQTRQPSRGHLFKIQKCRGHHLPKLLLAHKGCVSSILNIFILNRNPK